MSLNKITTGLILLSCGIGNAHAQDAVPAAGGNASGAGGTMSFSVGQVVYTTNTGTNGSVAQGVQHSYDIFNSLEEPAEKITLVFAYPNPVADALTLKIEEDDFTGLSYDLYNSQGQLVHSDLIVSSQTLVAMKDLNTATYFLRVKKNEVILQSFTIVKK